VFVNLNRALRVVRFDPVPTEFFETEAEARAWIVAQRKQQTQT
jgi:hypothetical protein